MPAVAPPAGPPRPALWFAVHGDRLLVLEAGEGLALPESPAAAGLEAVDEERWLYLGVLDDTDCFAVELEAEPAPRERTALSGLRPLYGRLADEHFGIAGRALQIVEWDRTHRFCGRCGEPTERSATERARRCPRCGLLSFPRLSPAVITLVERGSEILLARGVNFPEPMYSTLAGFVEPGESLEDAVQREVFEEVGVEVADVRYFGSQPWPFPHSLMIGFTAVYAGGEIEIDETELLDAGWFRKDDLPRVPPRLSIARALIDWAVERR